MRPHCTQSTVGATESRRETRCAIKGFETTSKAAQTLLDIRACACELLKSLVHMVKACINVFEFISDAAHELIAPSLLLRQVVFPFGHEIGDLMRKLLLRCLRKRGSIESEVR